MITAEAGTGLAAGTGVAAAGTGVAAGTGMAAAGTGVAAAGTGVAAAGEAQAGAGVAAGTKPEAGTTMVGISAGTSTGGVARDGEEPLPLRNSGMAGVGPRSAVGA
jgi:hypothetical protein